MIYLAPSNLLFPDSLKVSPFPEVFFLIYLDFSALEFISFPVFHSSRGTQTDVWFSAILSHTLEDIGMHTEMLTHMPYYTMLDNSSAGQLTRESDSKAYIIICVLHVLIYTVFCIWRKWAHAKILHVHIKAKSQRNDHQSCVFTTWAYLNIPVLISGRGL